MSGPWIRQVNVTGLAGRLRNDQLLAQAAAMRASPKCYSPAFIRAVRAEIERRRLSVIAS